MNTVTSRITDHNQHPWTVASDVTPNEPGLQVYPPIRSLPLVGMSADEVCAAYSRAFSDERTVIVLLDDATHLEPETIEDLVRLLHEKGIVDDDPSPTKILCVASRLTAQIATIN